MRKKPEHVINAVEMEHLLDVPDPRAPPVEVAPAQFIPAIIGDAPVLPPFLREGIHLEHLLRRRAPAPIEVEDGPVRPNVRAEPPHPERDVAHQIDLLRRAVGLERLPLAKGQPLDIHEEDPLALQLVAPLLRQRQQPLPRAAPRAMLRRPTIPRGQAAILLHQHAEQGVVGQPIRVLLQE